MQVNPELTLIDKRDNFEIIRDQIALILAVEIANQKQLAIEGGKSNPEDWDFKVCVEKSIPFQAKTDDNGNPVGDLSKGVVNVMFDSDTVINPGSTMVNRQRISGRFFVDCYGFKNTRLDNDTIESFGDTLSSFEVERVARLARNILKSTQYTYLKLGRAKEDTIVDRVDISTREKFFPSQNNVPIESVVGMRLVVDVEYHETAQEEVFNQLQEFHLSVVREDGFIYFELNKEV